MMRVINHPQIKLFLGVAGLLIGLSVGFNASVPATRSESNRSPAVAPQANLTGIWTGNDSATYYVRQVGNDVWWLGQSSDGGVTYTNLFRGIRSGDQIIGEWADVPAGRYLSNGSMTLTIAGTGSSVELRKVAATGNDFGASLWKQGGRAPRPPASSEPTTQFSVLPDGRVQKTEADGTIRIYGEGRDTVIFPGQQPQIIIHHDVQAATPPAGMLSQGGLNNWLQKQNERVLAAIEGLLAPGERASSMANIRGRQSGKSEFDQLNFSTGALSKMLR